MTASAKLTAITILAASTWLKPICTQAQPQGSPAAASQNSDPSTTVAVLSREQASAILPATVFFRGQSAPVQGRNSAGIRLPDGKLVLTALVDTAGYSSALQQNYQAYLLTEIPLAISGQTVTPGAYGFGFVANNQMVLMDLGGNTLLHASTIRDETLARPTPLQIRSVPGAPAFRLYLGRSYVTLAPQK